MYKYFLEPGLVRSVNILRFVEPGTDEILRRPAQEVKVTLEVIRSPDHRLEGW
jgi:hypothetical protein